MNVGEITEKLGLNSIQNREWFVQTACAVNGDGLRLGLDWLSDKFENFITERSVL
jgi:ADP-ribosylation factor protein 1